MTVERPTNPSTSILRRNCNLFTYDEIIENFLCLHAGIVLEHQFSLALDLYKHEDNLNWNKLNNFLYVTAACVALLAVALGKSGGERLYLCLATGILGIVSSASFGVTLWAGVTYLHTRKDTAREIEVLLIAHGGFPILDTKSETGTRLQRIITRSPTARVLRLIPLIVGSGWIACVVATFLAFKT